MKSRPGAAVKERAVADFEVIERVRHLIEPAYRQPTAVVSTLLPI